MNRASANPSRAAGSPVPAAILHRGRAGYGYSGTYNTEMTRAGMNDMTDTDRLLVAGDPLAAARGILFGALISAGMWAIIGGIVWWLV